MALTEGRRRLLRLVEDDDADLAECALLVAAEEYEGLDPAPYLDRLDAWAEHVGRALGALPGRRAGDPESEGEVLRGALLGPSSIAGLRGNSLEYYDPRNSYLNEVLDRGLGIPITLSVVWVAVARRAGLGWVGAGLPGHFVVRHLRAPVFVDPFHGGDFVRPADLPNLVARATGEPVASLPPGALEPAGARAVVARLLRNLVAVYGTRGDEARRARVADLLALVGGGSEPEVLH